MSMRTLALALAMAAISGSAIALEPEIRLEGKGETRTKLDAMSYKPFDLKLLDGLTGWSDATAKPTADSIKGKVVLIVTWASWYRTSHEALKMAQGLHEKLGPKGLIVVGVHGKQYSPEKAAEVTKTLGMAFPWAVDSSNAFQTAMLSDQYPDIYLVDRAGNLRFADVATSSMESAAEMLVDESAEAAAKATPAATAADTPADAAPSGAGGVPVDAAAYKAAAWPKANPARNLSAKDFQGKPLPKALGKEKYLGEKPDRAGKVTVLDFWATWCGPCRMAMPKLDKLQQQNQKDLVVIGISDEPERMVKDFLKKNPHGYAQAIDPSRQLNDALKIEGIPHVVVLSSDGVIRWQGNPLEPDFEKTVAAVIKADPGVRARTEPPPASAAPAAGDQPEHK